MLRHQVLYLAGTWRLLSSWCRSAPSTPLQAQRRFREGVWSSAPPPSRCDGFLIEASRAANKLCKSSVCDTLVGQQDSVNVAVEGEIAQATPTQQLDNDVGDEGAAKRHGAALLSKSCSEACARIHATRGTSYTQGFSKPVFCPQSFQKKQNVVTLQFH